MTSDGLGGAGKTAYIAVGRTGEELPDVEALILAWPPPASSPLRGMPDGVISPHSVSAVTTDNALLSELFTGNLPGWLAGRRLRNGCDRGAGH
jgi:hypothetical protein